MDAVQVLSLLDSDDSVRSHSSECLDLLEPRSNEEDSEEEPPRPKVLNHIILHNYVYIHRQVVVKLPTLLPKYVIYSVSLPLMTA